MSLKSFHIFFISASILMALGFAYWAMQVPNVLMGISSLAVGISLMMYLAWFIRKSKGLKHA